jgi:hypothetical protein
MQHFGPHMEWETKTYPNKRKDEYDAFCAYFARVMKVSEKAGPQSQIQWAITKQDTVREEYVETHYRNKVAALEAGFIDMSYFPSTIITEY